ncbi:MAG TPA: hypothetical protein DCY12_04340 [Candidatus Atribacteria bacterium]|nr:hypothetical protein [Candidatus Atribacteria bacterium]HCU21907.1 hypothetical protein [Candidatus Atribacteria bacterium]
MKRSTLFLVFNILLLVSFFTTYTSQARILSPEEGRLFLKRIIQNSTAHSYWGIWKLTDYTDENESIFYEVAYIPRFGFGWINLDNPHHYIIGDGTYRFIYDEEKQIITAVYPGFDLPFLPLGEDNIDILVSNYLINVDENVVMIISRENKQVVKSFLLDERQALISQTYYSKDGQVTKRGEYVYRIDHPNDDRIWKIFQIMDQVIQKKNNFPEVLFNRKPMLIPRLLPPGYSLRRSYLVEGDQGKMYQMVYSDGINFFSLFQTILSPHSKFSSRARKFTIKKDGELTTLIGEIMGRQVFLVGNLSHEILSEIFDSIADEGR